MATKKDIDTSKPHYIQIYDGYVWYLYRLNCGEHNAWIIKWIDGELKIEVNDHDDFGLRKECQKQKKDI